MAMSPVWPEEPRHGPLWPVSLGDLLLMCSQLPRSLTSEVPLLSRWKGWGFPTLMVLPCVCTIYKPVHDWVPQSSWEIRGMSLFQRDWFHFSLYLPHPPEEKMGETWLTFLILQDRNLWLWCDEGENLINGTNRWMLRSLLCWVRLPGLWKDSIRLCKML